MIPSKTGTNWHPFQQSEQRGQEKGGTQEGAQVAAGPVTSISWQKTVQLNIFPPPLLLPFDLSNGDNSSHFFIQNICMEKLLYLPNTRNPEETLPMIWRGILTRLSFTYISSNSSTFPWTTNITNVWDPCSVFEVACVMVKLMDSIILRGKNKIASIRCNQIKT